MTGRSELAAYGAVIPTYNTRELTKSCVEALLRSTHPPTTAVVVDNGTDGTADLIEATFPTVRVIRNASNTGFAGAINAGSELIDEPFVLWLNSDVLLARDDLALLVGEAGRRNELAAIAPRQLAFEGHPFPASFIFPSAFRPFRRRRHGSASGRLGPDEFLSGACLLIRRSAWVETGPLDPAFFFYWEEADWQFRARKLGWEFAVADVTVRHVGSGSSRSQTTAFRLLSFEGYERFILKHEGRAALLLHRGTNLPGVLWDASASFRRSVDNPRADAIARARLEQLLRPVPSGGTSPWAAQVRRPR